MNASKDFIMTTSSSIDGYRIIQQCGVVFGETVFKHGFLKSLGASISDAIDTFKFGSREMSGSVRLIEEAREYAYNKMISEAKARGANAIIAIESDNTMGGEIMYLSLYGTAVKVVREEDYEKQKLREKEKEEQEKLRMEKIKQEILEKKQKMREEILETKESSGFDIPENVDPEDQFINDIQADKSIIDVWKKWIYYGFDEKYRQLDTYINMKKDDEIAHGTPSNLTQIIAIISQQLENAKNGQ